MKLATTTVSYEGYAEEAWNLKRLSVAKRAIEKARNLEAQVLVLPGGFFTTHTSKARDSIATSLIDIAKGQNIVVIFGIDQDMDNLSNDETLAIKSGTLPSYVYFWSPTDEGPLHPWNQRSTNNRNQWDAPAALCRDVRLLKIEDDTVAVLICGEIFNERIRRALANHHLRPKVVVDIAHRGCGFRVERGMKKFAETGLSSVCSVHVKSEFAKKRCYIAGKGLASVNSYDAWLFGPPRIEIKLWTF